REGQDLSGDPAGYGGDHLVGDRAGRERPFVGADGGGFVGGAPRVPEDHHLVPGRGLAVRAQVHDDLVHADPSHLRDAAVPGGGAHEHLAAIAAGAVQTVGVAQRHQAQPGGLGGVVDASVADGVALGDVLDDRQAAGQGQGGTQRHIGGHRRVAVQGDAGAHQVAVQVGPGQQGGGVGDVLQRDGPDLVGERLTRGVEDLDLLVGGGVGRVVGAGQVGPGGDQL